MGRRLCCLRPSTSENQTVINVVKNDKLLQVKSITTLEDCLMNSPLNSMCIRGAGEIQVSKNPGKRVYPSFPNFDNNTFYTPRMSFSSTKKLEEVHELIEGSMSGSKSGKLKRKVTFKLPEEADVIFYYSPKDTLDGMDDS